MTVHHESKQTKRINEIYIELKTASNDEKVALMQELKILSWNVIEANRAFAYQYGI